MKNKNCWTLWLFLFVLVTCASPTYSQSGNNLPEGFIAIDEDTEKELRKNIAAYRQLISDHRNLKKSYADLQALYKNSLAELEALKKSSSALDEECNNTIDRIHQASVKAELDLAKSQELVVSLRKAVWDYRAEVYRLKNKKAKKNRGGDYYPPY